MSRALRKIKKEADEAFARKDFEAVARLSEKASALREAREDSKMERKAYALGLVGFVFIMVGFIAALVSAAYGWNVGLSVGVFILLNGLVFYIAGQKASPRD